LSVTFKNHPVTNDLVTVKDKGAIVQAIQGLLLTRKGERPFQPELGCDIQNILFEPLDYASSGVIKQEIKETLGRYEPRISIRQLRCTPDFDNNGYNVEMQYTIIGREDVPIGVEFILERTR
jgi:hypothetical protein